jgi:hypothetical protein
LYRTSLYIFYRRYGIKGNWNGLVDNYHSKVLSNNAN